MSVLQELKGRAIADVDARREALVRLSDTIHANPELAFEETRSAALLAEMLAENGFELERSVAGMETAFVATLGGQPGDPTVAFLAQYDALPGLGHACGHNIIAAAAVGAGLAMTAVLPELNGVVQVIGTPAEESGGGKVIMVDAGIFDAVDAVMMIHPSNRNALGRRSLAACPVSIEFFGKPAHAAAKPDEGINALEAVLLTFGGINALRQHLRDDVRIHGIITHGGEAPNIVPEYASADFLVRATDMAYALQVLEKVRACAEGAALATGARLQFRQSEPCYDARMPNPMMVTLFKENMETLGQEVRVATGKERMASSDLGNVSQIVPTICPGMAIGSETIGTHTVEFREAAVSQAGHEALIISAKAMAMTAIDLLAEASNLVAIKEAFAGQKRQQAD
jgi:amidohydrolase